MIASGVMVTCAHVIHMIGNPVGQLHKSFEVIRAYDIGQPLVSAQLIAEDVSKDIALLSVNNPKLTQSVILEPYIVNVGTSCGSRGFPLAYVRKDGAFDLTLHFQGAFISYYKQSPPYYEVDALMYNGSSGSPGFTTNAHVVGMQNKVVTQAPQTAEQQSPRAKTVQSPTDRFAI